MARYPNSTLTLDLTDETETVVEIGKEIVIVETSAINVTSGTRVIHETCEKTVALTSAVINGITVKMTGAIFDTKNVAEIPRKSRRKSLQPRPRLSLGPSHAQ
jgi:hypothetical protein